MDGGNKAGREEVRDIETIIISKGKIPRSDIANFTTKFILNSRINFTFLESINISGRS